jgi:hypothetical protein
MEKEGGKTKRPKTLRRLWGPNVVSMAVRRRQGRLDPIGAKRGWREAEKRVLWGHMAVVYAGRA